MNKKRILTAVLQLGGIALLVYVDYLLKELAVEHLTGAGTKVLIPHVVGLHLTQNTGAAFSLFSSSTSALSVVTGVVLVGVFILLTVVKKKPLIYDVRLPLIIAGGAGNLVDRIRQGYVVDYIRTLFMDFPIFNFADILITCSCVTLIIYLIWEMVHDHNQKKQTVPSKEEPAS